MGDRVRRAHVPVHRGAEPDGAGRARGHDVEDRRGPALLLPQRGISEEDAVNMIVNGFCKEVSRSCRWSSPSRRRSCWREPRRSGGLMTTTPMLRAFKDLHATVDDKQILRGSTSSAAGRSARDHGAERLGQEHARPGAGRPATATRVTGGEVPFEGQRPAGAGARGARARRRVPRLPVPGRDSGRQQRLLPQGGGECRCASIAGCRELDAMEFLTLVREKMKLMRWTRAS